MKSFTCLRRRKAIWLSLGLLSLYFAGAIFAQNNPPGKFYVIGTGPAGPEHATLKAIECMKAADIILCSDQMKKRFQDYLKGKPILCDPWKGMWSYKGKPWRELVKMKPEDKAAFQAARIKRREKIIKQIRAEIARGKKVALLDRGDPCLFGPSHWFSEGFDEGEVEIIPGMGCFSAAMAALRKSSIPAYNTRFVMQTSTFFLYGRPARDTIIKDLSKYPATMVFYMSLEDIKALVRTLKKYYPADLPVAVVYDAGYPGKERFVKGTLDNILAKIASENEQWLGTIVVGRCLEGKPYRGRVEKLVGYDDLK